MITESQFYFANISATEARKDLCTHAHAGVKTRVRTFYWVREHLRLVRTHICTDLHVNYFGGQLLSYELS